MKFATLTPNGPVGVESGEELKKVLARYTPEQISAQFDYETERAGQQINPEASDRFILEDEAKLVDVPHIFYNNKSANMGGVFFSNNADFQSFPSNTGQAIWTYKQVDGEGAAGNIGVVMGSPSAPNTPIASGAAGTVKVVVDFTVVTDAAQNTRTYDVTASIEGDVVFSVSGLTQPIYPNFALPIVPVFESSTSGAYTIEVEDSGDSGENFGFTYFHQRGLALADPLPDFTLSPGQSASFSNSFQWDFGDNPSSLQQASWDVKITDPSGALVQTLSGTGATIAATWDTTPLDLTGPIRLKPKGQDSPDGGTPIYGYEIKARALAYDNGSSEHQAYGPTGPTTYDDVFYELSSAVQSTELKIINVELTPDPPFQNEGDSVELTAEILAIGLGELTDEDIEWWVDLVGPDGNEVGDPLATGNGFEVSATWDGRVDGVAVNDPSAYTLRISAVTVCGGPSPRRSDLRAQMTSCLLAQASQVLTGPRLVVSGKEISGSTTAIKAIGYGFDPTLLENQTGGDSNKRRLRREALQNVHVLEESPHGGYDLTLEVQVEFPDGTEPPPVLTMQARNMLTGALITKDAKQTAVDKKVYRVEAGDPFNLSRAFVDADTASGADALTRYSIGEIYRDKAKLVPPLMPGKPGGTDVTSGVTEAFMHLVESSNAFPGPRVFSGKFAETAIDAETLTEIYPYKDTGGRSGEITGGATAPLVPPARIPTVLELVSAPLDDPLKVAYRALTTVGSVTNPPTAVTAARNLLTVGFVPIEITVSDVDTNQDPEPLSPVYLKVPRLPGLAVLNLPSRNSNVVLWTYHGSHDGSLSMAEDRNRVVSPAMSFSIGPTTAGMATSLETVHTLIMTSCDALDVNDFNSGKILRDPDGYPIPGIPPGANQRRFGGELWDQVMATETKQGLGQDVVILGYSDVAPLVRIESGKPVNSMAEIMTMFENELRDLSAAGVRPDELRQKAWMSANVKFADTTSGTGSPDAKWCALHATAIDKDYYYYIPQLKDRTALAGGGVSPITGRQQIITLCSVLREVKRSNPVYRVKRHPVWPPGVTPVGLPPGAVPEWGVYGPGTADHDLKLDFSHNRDKFAEKVSIPGLSFSQGRD